MLIEVKIMKYLFCAFCLAVLFFCISTPDLFAGSAAFSNRVEGLIFDEHRVPVGDMYVELHGDSGSTLQTLKATTTGRFTFQGLSSGSYSVRVIPSGKNFLE